MSKIKLADLSTEELEKLLQERKKKEAKQMEAKRKEYESQREILIKSSTTIANRLNKELVEFKANVLTAVEGFYDLMKEYGDVREMNKGNFTIKSLDNSIKMEVTRNITFGFDERGNQAETLVKEFLKEKIKKADKDAYELISSLLERDQKTGKFDPRNIHKLYKFETSFQDDRFQKAVQLFKEAYTEQKTSQYVRFYTLNEQGKYEAIALNFSSI